MKKIKLINGPNLNMLGIRNPEVYGTTTLCDIEKEVSALATKNGVLLSCFQSNSEGAIIDEIQSCYKNFDGIIINAGAYTHYSIAIRDAIESVMIPTVEVHLSDIHKREAFRHVSMIEDVCIKQICGKGIDGYFEALLCLVDEFNR